MGKLRTVYDIYMLEALEGLPPVEEYIETLEFDTPQALSIYLDKLRKVTGNDFTAKLSLLWVKQKEGAKK